MKFPTKYKALNKNVFRKGDCSLVPIRYEDRQDIMKWRNEQMYHLRQTELLTEISQEKYFKNNVALLFEQDKPSQLLFSYLKKGACIGYGGLVHINRDKKSAEVSFIMNTQLEENEFEIHWSSFLGLLKKVAFGELKLDKVFTYAYNLRPHLYPVLEKNDFELTERKEKEIELDGKLVDVLIHECQNPKKYLSIRKCLENDLELVYNWSNDKLVRNQSFNSEKITKEGHEKWFLKKLQSSTSLMLVNEFKEKPAGLVRFEIDLSTSTIGILIDKEFRGKNLSSLMLERSSSVYFESNDKPILAFIKESNGASIKAFEKARFKFLKKDVVNEFTTLVYKLEKNG